jgi:hypothetical protein
VDVVRFCVRAGADRSATEAVAGLYEVLIDTRVTGVPTPAQLDGAGVAIGSPESDVLLRFAGRVRRYA